MLAFKLSKLLNPLFMTLCFFVYDTALPIFYNFLILEGFTFAMFKINFLMYVIILRTTQRYYLHVLWKEIHVAKNEIKFKKSIVAQHRHKRHENMFNVLIKCATKF